MPSPFPGMDPFIEPAKWQTFHTRFIAALGDAVVEQVRPKYVVDVDQDVYLVREPGEKREILSPDVAMLESDRRRERVPEAASDGAAVTLQPVVREIRLPHPRRQLYLSIRTKDGLDLVTVIELLSPANKTPGKGRRQYLKKREKLLSNNINLVELDLFRSGRRLPTRPRLPSADYYAIVCRAEELPQVKVYAWTMRERLPVIPVPLGEDDSDAALDLQRIFEQTYDRAGFDYSLDYEQVLSPPLDERDRVWVQDVLLAANIERRT